MKVKYQLLGTLAAGVTLFVWGMVSHVVLSWHDASMKRFTDNQAVVETIKANAPENAVYFSPEGLFAVVSFLPDMSDQTQDITADIARQLVLDLVVGFLLAMILLSVQAPSVLGKAAVAGRMGLAAGVAIHIAHWNWYGFSPAYTLVNLFDPIISWFLAGLVLAALIKKMQPAG